MPYPFIEEETSEPEIAQEKEHKEKAEHFQPNEGEEEVQQEGRPEDQEGVPRPLKTQFLSI